MPKCPTCGSEVRVVGNTTLHYEPNDENRENERLRSVLRSVWANGVCSGELKELVRKALSNHTETPDTSPERIYNIPPEAL